MTDHVKTDDDAVMTELAGVAEAETQAAYAWALDDGVDDLPTQRLTSRRITALSLAASLIVIALAGVVALLVLRQHEQPTPAPAPAPVVETTTPPPPPVTVTVLPPPPPVTVTATVTPVAPPPVTKTVAPKPSPSPEGSIGHACSPHGATQWNGLDGELVCNDGVWMQNDY